MLHLHVHFIHKNVTTIIGQMYYFFLYEKLFLSLSCFLLSWHTIPLHSIFVCFLNRNLLRKTNYLFCPFWNKVAVCVVCLVYWSMVSFADFIRKVSSLFLNYHSFLVVLLITRSRRFYFIIGLIPAFTFYMNLGLHIWTRLSY